MILFIKKYKVWIIIIASLVIFGVVALVFGIKWVFVSLLPISGLVGSNFNSKLEKDYDKLHEDLDEGLKELDKKEQIIEETISNMSDDDLLDDFNSKYKRRRSNKNKS